MPLNATERQIPNANRPIFDLAKPILASILYLRTPWPGSVQAEAALCGEAWQLALHARSVQLMAVGAIERYGHVATAEGGAAWEMGGLARGIVSLS